VEFGAGNQRLLDALGVAVVQVGQVERLHHVESSALARSAELELPEFHLVPLGAQRNESDHAAWASSSAHIRATPGFESSGWPPVEGMSLDANRGDLEGHARDFAERTGFTFTVLRPGTEEVIGCVYIYRKGRRRRCVRPLLGSR
jgi:hypothetical protein